MLKMCCQRQLVEENRSLVQLYLATGGRRTRPNPRHTVAHTYCSLMESWPSDRRMMRCRPQLVEEKRSLVQLYLATGGRGTRANKGFQTWKVRLPPLIVLGRYACTPTDLVLHTQSCACRSGGGQ
jgi:hypothetical protein